MQSKYFVAHEEKQIGPFTLDEIVAKIESKELQVSDYIYDDVERDWFMIAAYPAFANVLKNGKPGVAPASEPPKPKVETPEWYVLKGQNRFGPYAYFDVLKLLQSRSVYEYDYAWNPKLQTWSLIADLPDFKPEKIKEVKDTVAPSLTEVFFRRRHARTDYGASLIIHNNSQVWKGKSLEIGMGGAGLELESGQVQIGQILHIHFKPGDGVPPFNAKCEVVSKRGGGNSKSKDEQTVYGVKFVEISNQTQQYLTEFAGKKAAA